MDFYADIVQTSIRFANRTKNLRQVNGFLETCT